MLKKFLDKIFNIINYLYFLLQFNYDNNNDNIDTRMRFMLEKCNSGNFNNDQMYIISVRSKSLAKFLNEKSPSFTIKLKELEEHNIILDKICTKLFIKFSPILIYTFNDEFLLIFDHSKNKVNINKQLTSITSYITRLLTIELSKSLNDDIYSHLDFTLSAKWISFSDNNDAFKFILSRQKRCTLLNLNLLYNYFEKSKSLLSLDILLNKLMNIPETKLIKDFIIYGSTFYYYTPQMIFENSSNFAANSCTTKRILYKYNSYLSPIF